MQIGKDIAVKFPGLFLVHHNIPGSAAPHHEHPEHHLIIPLQGEISIDVDAKVLTCSPGRMAYVPPNTGHIFRSAPTKGERLICMIDQTCWKSAETHSYQATLLPASQLCKELLFYLLLNPKTKNASPLIDAFVCTVVESLEAPSLETPFLIEHAEGSVARPELKKALKIAREGFTTDLSVTELARLSGLSVRNMSRLFLTELGVTPKQLLMSLRIDLAKELLLAGSTVTETAYGVGYQSLSQFIQSFRQITGQIPSEYQGQSQFGRKTP
jgi:AraC-like DNA-binding protein/mannose-6-phosphate isomerase-like protein (cupin superfamily)